MMGHVMWPGFTSITTTCFIPDIGEAGQRRLNRSMKEVEVKASRFVGPTIEFDSSKKC
jgi:hypothetical protein